MAQEMTKRDGLSQNPVTEFEAAVVGKGGPVKLYRSLSNEGHHGRRRCDFERGAGTKRTRRIVLQHDHRP